MQPVALEPLRWQEDPCRVTVYANDSAPAVYYQVTSPRRMEAICCGRPVEELSRILPILGPAHHLAAARALDRLFAVQPPELAQNMRTALLQAQTCSFHLRKIFFLMTSRQDPFGDFRSFARGVGRPAISRGILEKTMHHAALAQEAEAILGGRHEHPLTAVAGGMSRYLKEGHGDQLSRICDALTPFARELAEFMRLEILAGGGTPAPWLNVEIPALAGLHLAADDRPTFTDPEGGASQAFDAQQMGDRIGLQQESWTYLPFAYRKENGWPGLKASQGLFYVGPLARFNAGQTPATPLAKQEHQQMTQCLGTPPVYRLAAAFGALAVELIEAAETMQGLCRSETWTGPVLRTIPERRAASTWAVLEAPQGLMWHHYQIDADGLVNAMTVMDSSTVNNALKCLLAEQIVSAALAAKTDPAAIKERVEVALLPF